MPCSKIRLTDQFTAELERKRNDVKTHSHASIEAMLAELEDFINTKPCKGASCAAAQVLLHAVLYALREQRLWPRSDQNSRSISRLCEKMEGLEVSSTYVQGFACRKKERCIAFDEDR